MGDIAQEAASTKQALLELGKQVHTLGVGLQHAAPSDKAGESNPTIQYLTEVASVLMTLAVACDHVVDNEQRE